MTDLNQVWLAFALAGFLSVLLIVMILERRTGIEMPALLKVMILMSGTGAIGAWSSIILDHIFHI